MVSSIPMYLSCSKTRGISNFIGVLSPLGLIHLTKWGWLWDIRPKSKELLRIRCFVLTGLNKSTYVNKKRNHMILILTILCLQSIPPTAQKWKSKETTVAKLSKSAIIKTYFSNNGWPGNILSIPILIYSRSFMRTNF